ncbi:hypothetical protein [Isoptericola hypogeus]|uniref:hypothetical protein n=1 Tax=Isoptericola hypogeus TaxID=300179 RepID=UPI0031DB54FB
MATTSGPDPYPDLDATHARDQLARAETVAPGTARDRRRHALGLLAAGVVMAAVACASALTRGPWSILWTVGTWVGAVLVILWIGKVVEHGSRTTPRGVALAARAGSWIAFGALVVGRTVLDALSDDAPLPAAGVLLLGLAVLLPLAAAAHRIWWDSWLPGRAGRRPRPMP